MKAKAGWTRPGWPWELELVVFVAYAATIALPAFFPDLPLPDFKGLFPEERRRAVQEYVQHDLWRDQKDLTWFFAITPFYVLHLISGWYASRYFSTPLVHMLSPTLMTLVLYYRLLTQPVVPGQERLFIAGTPLEGAAWVGASILLTLVLARIRMARYMLNFRGVEWDLTTLTRRDGTFWSLAGQFTPLFYPIRYYHVFPEGAVAEGWFYGMAIPFNRIESIKLRNEGERIASGLVLATSRRHMVEIKIQDSDLHILLSPADYEEFTNYIAQRVAGHRKEQGHAHPVLVEEKPHPTARKTRKSAFAPGGVYARREPEHRPRAESGDRKPEP